ncbi:hypothetical protein DEALK_18470 [Dehalogenimonas alkenigignens]|uniref:Uncharacterized protein n=1 Tax=Dehalogenimonas alkenigignens TaxID=1217799 RepID=A0A0W0GKE7_9CHLR|nr:hypothetical protein [Dehalogenimonas alkenigignens]KTB49000.1 hypothetical protein DEALK_18470 [Dehalogenimonas alkenigignens]
MFITLDEATEIITPELASNLAYCASSSFKDWFTEVSENGRATSTPCTKASFINDRMIHYAKTLFPPTPGSAIRVIKIHGRYQILIENKLIFKMKKLNQNLLTSNIPTRTVINFNRQLCPPEYGTQLRFTNMPDDITHLIVGYRENSLKTGIGCFITCPDGKRNRWIFPIGFAPLPIVANNYVPVEPDSPRVQPKKVTPKIQSDLLGVTETHD